MKKIGILLSMLLLTGCTQTNPGNPPNQGGQSDTMKTIQINPKVDILNENNESELLVAVHHNDQERAITLINQGANVNLQDTLQDSPYLYAGAEGRTEILKYMLEHADIDFNVVNRFGGNALIPAAEKGHIDNVKLLVADDRIDLDFQNNFGYTALIEAVALTDGSQVYIDIVEILVQAGANIDIKDHQGMSARDYAHERGYTEMIKILSQETAHNISKKR